MDVPSVKAGRARVLVLAQADMELRTGPEARRPGTQLKAVLDQTRAVRYGIRMSMFILITRISGPAV
jgi:hypothetical protein